MKYTIKDNNGNLICSVESNNPVNDEVSLESTLESIDNECTNLNKSVEMYNIISNTRAMEALGYVKGAGFGKNIINVCKYLFGKLVDFFSNITKAIKDFVLKIKLKIMKLTKREYKAKQMIKTLQKTFIEKSSNDRIDYKILLEFLDHDKSISVIAKYNYNTAKLDPKKIEESFDKINDRYDKIIYKSNLVELIKSHIEKLSKVNIENVSSDDVYIYKNSNEDEKIIKEATEYYDKISNELLYINSTNTTGDLYKLYNLTEQSATVKNTFNELIEGIKIIKKNLKNDDKDVIKYNTENKKYYDLLTELLELTFDFLDKHDATQTTNLLNKLNDSIDNLDKMNKSIDQMNESMKKIKIRDAEFTDADKVNKSIENIIIRLSTSLKELITVLSNVSSRYWNIIKNSMLMITELNETYADIVQVFGK